MELTIELSSILRGMDTMHAALLVKVDSRKQRLANDARQTLEGFGVDVMAAEIPLLAAFEKAEVEGVCVSDAVDDRGRADLRRMGGWSAYCNAALQIRERLMAVEGSEAISAERLGCCVGSSGGSRQCCGESLLGPVRHHRHGVVTVSRSSSIRKKRVCSVPTHSDSKPHPPG